MAGQGAITQAYAANLEKQGWQIVYTCIPNTPHVSVIAIPIGGSSKQCYPDILAFADNITKLVEVEIRLTQVIAAKITAKFAEILSALSPGWKTFRGHVKLVNGVSLPESFCPSCELIICGSGKSSHQELVGELNMAGISVKFWQDFVS
jgi:hypothetical protein